MILEKDKIGLFNYTLTNTKGEQIDASNGQPIAYLHGYQNLIPGLEKELAGKSVGDTFKTTIQPIDGYGEIQERLIQKDVPISMFQDIDNIEVGMRFEAQSEDNGIHSVEVTEKNGDTVTVDGNHPLAGKELTFDIEITGIRAASKEELEHGHAHGEGGHKH